MSTKPPLNESFTRAMAYYKSLTGKSNKDIADALGVPATTVSSWNTGRHLPDMDRLQRLATDLNAPIEQFFDFSLDRVQDNDLAEIHTQINTDEHLAQFIKIYSKLSTDDKHLIALLTLKLSK